MSIRLLILLLLLQTAATPSASALPTTAAHEVPSGGGYDQSGGDWERSADDRVASGGDWERPGGDWDRLGGDWKRLGGDGERPGGDGEPPGVVGAPMRAANLRVFALYGPREFSTFRADPTSPWPPGETVPRGAPFDRHAEDRWLGVDKAKHVAFSFLWTLGTQYVAVNKARFSEARAIPISVGTSAAVGLSKEYYDLHMGPSQFFSYKDLVADGVGILIAVGIILL